VTETAYYVHSVLVLRLPGVTEGYCLRIFAFYIQCLTVAGVSQPSSNVAREIRISQEPQSYQVLFRYTVVLAKVARPTHMWRAWPRHS